MPFIDRTDRILQDVLDRITPTQKEQEKTREVVEKVMSATRQAIRGKKLDFVLAGSFTRDTWMKDKKEFDIFIRFPSSASRDDLEKKGLELGKEIARILRGRYTIAYAEHPYVRVRVGSYDVDVVPCYRVESALKIKSAVDRTPFHNEWLSEHFLKELAPDVRLLKQFCKGQGIYGSDAKTQGFSGYLCELLIINYRTFKRLASEAQKWVAGNIVINLEGVYPIRDIKAMHKKFPKQPLIVIDPVDPGRNVAAALSPENFVRFIRACRNFTEKPSTDFFFRKPPNPNISRIERELSRRRTFLTGFSCPAPKVIEDVLWPQLRRTCKRIRNIFEDNDFIVHGNSVWSDGRICVFLFELETQSLSNIKKLQGPSIFSDTHSKNFLNKYKPLGRVWVEDEFWVAEVQRPVTDSSKLLESIISRNESELRADGIASHVSKEIARSHSMMSKRDIVALARKSKEFGQFLQDYLEKNLA